VKNSITAETQTDKERYTAGEAVKLSITASNETLQPLQLFFTSSQRYDFAVLKDKSEVWRWSSDKMFSMQTETIFLSSGEKLAFEETWIPENLLELGEYEAVGFVTAQPVLCATCKFKIEK
jgi:hypothetical protein